ncbi:hypothetical protein OJAV_G00177560 [Oryzias javanicus]|uniref:Uncharacterized protein n=1 Tax=Oryzias javanicus TaxID=123683 RepID=A0A437CHJ1_ORYJA|nr:hypothetical protein OJAV_G00177560 [Oryzias javanicus]
MSSYYIAPFIDTQTMPRRTWDRKYKRYDVTPRTAMIIANCPRPAPDSSPSAGPQDSAAPPGTFYKPPLSSALTNGMPLAPPPRPTPVPNPLHH